MAQGDLTSLANLKTWLAITTATQDVLLGRLVTSASAFVANYLNRPYIGSTLISERYDGRDRDTLMLRHGPVTSIVSIAFGGKTITAGATGNPPAGGWLLDPTYSTAGRVTLTDDTFDRGRLNVLVTYRAGYLVSAEPQTAGASVTANLTWLTDAGVTYANGVALTPVASAPGVGQYTAADGAYAFNAADYSAAVLISYGTVPADIEQATIELAGERFAAMGRIGYVTQTLAGQEVTSFSQADMSNAIKAMLSSYRRTAPI
jgi:hypothetical protein